MSSLYVVNIARVLHVLDDLNLIDDYLAGASLVELARRYGVPYGTLRSRLVAAGVPRRRNADSTRITAKAQRSAYSGEVAERFLAGESVKSLATAYGRKRSHIALCLADHGIRPRNRSEGMYARMANTSREERLRLAAKAHEATRNAPPEFHRANAEKQALRKQATLSKVGAGEPEMLQWLRERGHEGVPQLPCGVYNIDIAVGALAVEVHVNPSNPHARPFYQKRIKHLLRSGFDVLYVKVTKQRPLTAAAADYAVAFLEARRRNPAAPREYRVVWSDKQGVAAFRFHLDQDTLVPVAGDCPDVT